MRMFSIGSKVVHPFYGAGTVAEIEHKSIGEFAHPYYVIDTVSRPMQVMVPVSRAEEYNLRYVGRGTDLRVSLRACSACPLETEIVKDIRVRQATMRDQLKSGDFDEIVQVARLLFFMNKRRPLGTVDRQMLEQGKDFLAGELALAVGLAFDTAMQEVEDHLMAMFAASEVQ